MGLCLQYRRWEEAVNGGTDRYRATRGTEYSRERASLMCLRNMVLVDQSCPTGPFLDSCRFAAKQGILNAECSQFCELCAKLVARLQLGC
jgi:hypothetical protein